jgi:hypothetical protein
LRSFFGILFEILFLWENFFLERPRTILITFLDIEICRNFPNFCRENFDLFWKFLIFFVLMNLFCGSLFDHEMAFLIAIIGIDIEIDAGPQLSQASWARRRG